MPIYLSFLGAVLGIYLLIVLGMYLFQRSLMYHPQRAKLDPAQFHLSDTNALTLTSEDGTKVTAWHHPASENMPTIIYFHGNAAHLGVDYRVERFQGLIAHGFGLLALSYRGYGDSEGSPTEAGLFSDARATMHYAFDTLKLSPEQTLIFGESLGSGVAVKMATEFTAKGIVLDSPYTSIADRSAELYPWLPVRLILKDQFDSLSRIKDVHLPLLIVHGDADKVIPIHHGKVLLAAANAPKHGEFLAGVAHVATPPATLIHAVSTFFRLPERS